jgi:hypothetical protein
MGSAQRRPASEGEANCEFTEGDMNDLYPKGHKFDSL